MRDLQAAFAENWLESSGELLTDTGYFRWCEDERRRRGHGRVQHAHHRPLRAQPHALPDPARRRARRRIHITTPYFLPDRSARAEMVRAIQERGVAVKIITPGQHSDHLLTRRSSRRLYGPLLKAGAKIYEYEPTMIHTKVLVVDGIWSVVGSTNFDHRSFGINDEVNLAVVRRGAGRRACRRTSRQDLARQPARHLPQVVPALR